MGRWTHGDRERNDGRRQRGAAGWRAAIVVLAAMLAAPALANAQTTFTAELVDGLDSGRPGDVVGAVTGSGCPHGTLLGEPVPSRVLIGVPHSDPGALMVADPIPTEDGAYNADLVIPAEATPGVYELLAVCRDPGYAAEAVLGDVEILPPLDVPAEISGSLGSVVTAPGASLAFTAPVQSTAFGDPDPFIHGQQVTLVRYPGAEIVGTVTAPESLDQSSFEIVVDAPDELGSHHLVAFGRLEAGGPLGTLRQVHVASIEVVADAPCPTSPFADVPTSHPFCAEIEWLADSDIAGGYPDDSFRPAIDVTRQALAAFLFRLAGEPDDAPPATPSFTDVPPSHPFYDEIEWLAGTGITTGYPDDTFRPSLDVTRQATAAFLHRSAGEPDVTAPMPSFADVPGSHPFYDEIEWLAGTGITTGYPDDTFRPSLDVTRQATAAFLFRWAHLPS